MSKKLRRWELIERTRTRENKFFVALAIDFLSYFGNKHPTKGQIRAMEDLLGFVFIRRGLHLDSRLTYREKVCLYLSSQGKNTADIADFFKVTTRAIESTRQGIFEKLDCKKITQAITLGIRYGALPEQ